MSNDVHVRFTDEDSIRVSVTEDTPIRIVSATEKDNDTLNPIRDDAPVDVTIGNDQPINIITVKGKDGASLHPRGFWNAENAYEYLDLVSYNGNAYLAKKDVPTGTVLTNTEYWQVLLVGSSTFWGNIEGNIINQTDLIGMLAGKADTDDVYIKDDIMLVEEAPMDGGLYLRRNGGWVRIEFKRLRL